MKTACFVILFFWQFIVLSCHSIEKKYSYEQNDFNILLIGEHGTSSAEVFSVASPISITLESKLSEFTQRKIKIYDYTHKKLSTFENTNLIDQFIEKTNPNLVYYIVASPHIFSRDLTYQNTNTNTCPVKENSSWFNEKTILSATRNNFSKLTDRLINKKIKFSIILGFQSIGKISFLNYTANCKSDHTKIDLMDQEKIILYLQKKNIPLLVSKKIKDPNAIIYDNNIAAADKTSLYESSFANNLIPWILPDID